MARRLTVNNLIEDAPLFINGKTGSIYLITNIKTGFKYIGQTTLSLHERWRHHARTRNEYEDGLGNDIQRFGASSFSVLLLAGDCPIDELDALEQFYIMQYNTLKPNGYNLTPGGKCFIRQEQHKDRISKSKVGLTFTDKPKLLASVTRIKKGKPRGQNSKPVIGTHIITGEVIELPSVSLDPRFDGRLISACCRGKRRQHRGYQWRYKNG